MRICDACGPKHGHPVRSQKRRVTRCDWCKAVLPTVDAEVYGIEGAKAHELQADSVALTPFQG